MAAPAAEAPAAVAAPVLPPARRKDADPARLQTPPLLPAAGWSDLAPDLVRRVADSLVAANDLDCYMDFRAVCSVWRAATDDPRSDPFDPRFRPRRWVILDDGDDLLLLNAATGRFLRKRIPLLRRYHVLAATPGGFFVLADRHPSRAACVFNPLTGVLIRFAAPVPTKKVAAASVVFGPSSWPTLTLNLLCDSPSKSYSATPDMESFEEKELQLPIDCHISLKAVRGGVYADGGGAAQGFRHGVSVIFDIFDLIQSLHVHPSMFYAEDLPVAGHANDHTRFFIVEFGGEVLIVIKLQRRVKVFKMDVSSIVPVESIGSHAIFIGHHRCLAVDTDKFPSVESNCVYYVERLGSSAHICMYNLKDEKDERISAGDVDFVKLHELFVLAAHRPFTIIQLLSSYTINVRDSQLPLQQGAN
ncbi:uncharacterized protein LOC119270307 [Triticum dicoccoides]|uniref:uncharacterized protein LOC119270307 n=1 Tax=Triticum dicoccoides TaxID=85692 RepID=UPI00188E80FE|nr:uncharacterized protein LOC119270307 [Triticum dicoccoides]